MWSAEHHVYDDVGDVVHNFQALLNSRDGVDIPDSATVHQSVALKVLRWEDTRDRRARDCSLRNIFKRSVRLVERNIIARHNINRADRETTFDAFELIELIGEPLQHRRGVEAGDVCEARVD